VLLQLSCERRALDQAAGGGARCARHAYASAHRWHPCAVGGTEWCIRRDRGRLRAGTQAVSWDVVARDEKVGRSADRGAPELGDSAAPCCSRTGESRFRVTACTRTGASTYADAVPTRGRVGQLVIASTRLRALGTTAVLCTTDPTALPRARRELVRELRAVDLLASRFRRDSELTALNSRAGERICVSRRLFEAVALAVEVAQRTDGLVDPTVGRALRLAGYDRTFVAVRARDGSFLAVSHRSPGWRSIQLDPESLEIGAPAGVELDLGATAKAATADTVATSIHTMTGSGVLISLGGDVAVAGPAPAGGWPIRLADSHDAPLGSEGPVVAVHEGGLATSGVSARRWHVHDGERHHIIDPRTGSSAITPWRTATVTGATCVDANAASTAALVLGADAPAWLGLRGFSARLVRHDGSVAFVGEWPRVETQAA
jgi:FAD:protein FMN transferase